jgi:hypothetical protein
MAIFSGRCKIGFYQIRRCRKKLNLGRSLIGSLKKQLRNFYFNFWQLISLNEFLKLIMELWILYYEFELVLKGNSTLAKVPVFDFIKKNYRRRVSVIEFLKQCYFSLNCFFLTWTILAIT